MATAEAHNDAGRQAFQVGNYAKAAHCYEAAIAADPRNAKYHTNLANVHLKLNEPFQAQQAAQNAIQADPRWIKGYYYSALARDSNGEFTRALADCSKGLEVDRSNAALMDLQKTVEKHKKQLHQLEERESKRLQRPQCAVRYNATICDYQEAKKEQSFSFVHTFDAGRVQRAVTDHTVASKLIEEAVMPHYKEMLLAKQWACLACHRPARKLLLHPSGYLQLPEPLIQDIGPSPTCGDPQCDAYCYQLPRGVMAEAMEVLGKSPPADGGLVVGNPN